MPAPSRGCLVPVSVLSEIVLFARLPAALAQVQGSALRRGVVVNGVVAYVYSAPIGKDRAADAVVLRCPRAVRADLAIRDDSSSSDKTHRASEVGGERDRSRTRRCRSGGENRRGPPAPSAAAYERDVAVEIQNRFSRLEISLRKRGVPPAVEQNAFLDDDREVVERPRYDENRVSVVRGRLSRSRERWPRQRVRCTARDRCPTASSSGGSWTESRTPPRGSRIDRPC